MDKKNKLPLYIFLVIDAVFAVIAFVLIAHPSLNGSGLALLHPKGTIALQERNLLLIAVLIMLVGAVPVYVLIFFFAWKYRASNTAATYSPNMDSKVVAGLIWLIPASIIFVIGILNWKSTHSLDPTKPIASDKKPLTIQVVALPWKWLFIYPQQNIATINFIEFPEGTPVSFQLTADAPMSSFWIPQLGGQMYAMAGMTTQIHLMASALGDFRGANTEINGRGFAGMKFIARAASDADFNAWLQSVKSSPNTLDMNEYDKLAQPSENNPTASYSSVVGNMFNSVEMKFMAPKPAADSSSAPMAMPGMNAGIPNDKLPIPKGSNSN